MQWKARTFAVGASTVLTLTAAAALALPQAAAAHECRYAHASPQAISTGKARSAIHCLLNKRRRAHGLGPLHLRGSMDRAAHRHSRYMQQHGCFSHECPGEPALPIRLRLTHYLLPNLRRWTCGEDIAWARGWRRAKAVHIVREWMHSPPHRANILRGGFHDLGVGVAWGTPYGAKAGGVYTIDFGSRRR